jgi:hypothetical protein
MPAQVGSLQVLRQPTPRYCALSVRWLAGAAQDSERVTATGAALGV